jgi:hypothetical protein
MIEVVATLLRHEQKFIRHRCAVGEMGKPWQRRAAEVSLAWKEPA